MALCTLIIFSETAERIIKIDDGLGRTLNVVGVSSSPKKTTNLNFCVNYWSQ